MFEKLLELLTALALTVGGAGAAGIGVASDEVSKVADLVAAHKLAAASEVSVLAKGDAGSEAQGLDAAAEGLTTAAAAIEAATEAAPAEAATGLGNAWTQVTTNAAATGTAGDAADDHSQAPTVPAGPPAEVPAGPPAELPAAAANGRGGN